MIRIAKKSDVKQWAIDELVTAWVKDYGYINAYVKYHLYGNGFSRWMLHCPDNDEPENTELEISFEILCCTECGTLYEMAAGNYAENISTCMECGAKA